MYTNELHEALIRKRGRDFWNCWRSKFDIKRPRFSCINGIADDREIADKFAQYFAETCSPLSTDGNRRLYDTYIAERQHYSGMHLNDELKFDASLVEDIILNMKKGKAAGLDGLTVENLQFCHPCLPTLLAKFFNFLIDIGKVPDKFGLSYTVPIPKGGVTSITKPLTVNDFRGISISPVLSKVFENCILSRYGNFLMTSDNQFGFKKSLSCSHAIYSVRQVVDHFTLSRSTVNLCAIDVRKAFDKMSHYGLFTKLMKRMIPNSILNVLEHWFSICYTCVRWGSCISQFVALTCGVRQGGVLSPHFFAIYIDDINYKVAHSDVCAKISSICVSIFMYADDILLISPSVSYLQQLVRLVETELDTLDLAINSSKCVCLRIGQLYNNPCSTITLYNGNALPWVTNCRYLGIYIKAYYRFKCDFDHAKKSLYRSFNAIYGKVGRCASTEVVFSLLKSKCLPSLLYGLPACPVNKSESNSLDFTIYRVSAKVLGTASGPVVNECREAFGLGSIRELISNSKKKFIKRYVASVNMICGIFTMNANNELAML